MTTAKGNRIPTYAPHLKIQLSGQLGLDGAAWEIFSYSIAYGGAGGINTSPAHLNGLIDAVLAFHGRALSGISAYAQVKEVKVAQVNANGTWAGATPLLRRAVSVPGGITGAQANLTHAPQVAMAVTLRTATPGPRGRGRFYLPLPQALASTVDAMIQPLDAQRVAGSVVQMINDLNLQEGAAPSAERVSVASTFGGLAPVTRVQVGRVLDTIRSRRNATRETYETGPAIT